MTVLDSSLLLQSPLQTPVTVVDTNNIIPRKRKLKSSSKNMECSSEGADLETDGLKNESTPSKKQKMGSKQVSRGRRKSRWKLKFHHQALPPEYLKHYKQQEKKRRITETKKVSTEKSASKKTVEKRPIESLEPDTSKHCETNDIDDDMDVMKARHSLDSPQGEMNQIDEARDSQWPGSSILGESFPHLNIDLSQNKAFLENLLSNQIEINRVDRIEKAQPLPKPPKTKKPKAIPSSGRIMNFSDLPYMGEITLDGVKPRRGRKPKKADICHLIYKNYGQVFPGAPNSSLESPKENNKWKCGRPSSVPTPQTRTPMTHPQVESPLPTVTGLLKHSEVQNRIINSLLERRLTQKIRGKPESFTKPNETSEEPLNLCLKDLQSLKIKLSRKHGNIYETKTECFPKEPIHDLVEVKKEVIDLDSDDSSVEDSDLAPFNLVTAELRDSEDDDSISLGSLGNQVTMTKLPETPSESPLLPPDPMMYWPTSNYFYPPLPVMPDMYYPKLPTANTSPSEKRPIKPSKNKSSNKRLNTKPNNAAQVIARRKRSAIFIPPVPAENTTNPATEVSICKFKFIGGAKPSLQEKKMLSVDSGGNFRYYSGTGDKSMRGYEYFPRESLQQCQENTGCSPSGVFLTASALGSGEKIPEDVGHSGFFDQSFPLQVTSTPTPVSNSAPIKTDQCRKGSKQRENLGIPLLPDNLPEDFEGDDDDDDSDSEASNGALSSTDISLKDMNEDSQRRARRSRKSLAREKLEQSFKENGFLIQTQQLESAEGATYCKFRQLRKFTRYLFRSWKDYLPGNVRDLSETVGTNNVGDDLVTPSSSPSVKLDSPDL